MPNPEAIILKVGSETNPSIRFEDDEDTGLFWKSAGVIGFASQGSEAYAIGAASGGTVFNEDGEDVDFRVEGANNATLFNLDAGSDSIALGGAVVDGAAVAFNNLTSRTMITSVGTQNHIPAQSTTFDNASETVAVGAAAQVGIQTWLGGTASLTITQPASVYIAGIPVASTNVVFTNTALALWVDAGVSRFDGNVDLNATGTLVQVGNTTNTWTGTQFIHKGTGQSFFELDGGSGTTGPSANLNIKFSTTGNAGDTFGAAIKWLFTDSGATNVPQGNIHFGRDGADNQGTFKVATCSGSTSQVINFKVGHEGEIYANVTASGSTANVNIFDDYDDPKELQTYAYCTGIVPGMSEQEVAEGRQRLVDMDVMQYDKTNGHHYIKIKALSRLLAGGIYQNRHRIDENTDRIEHLEMALARL